MLKDRHGESLFDYLSRHTTSEAFRQELDRRIVQHSISNKLESVPFSGVNILPLLLQELCFYYIKVCRVVYVIALSSFLVY